MTDMVETRISGSGKAKATELLRSKLTERLIADARMDARETRNGNERAYITLDLDDGTKVMIRGCRFEITDPKGRKFQW